MTLLAVGTTEGIMKKPPKKLKWLAHFAPMRGGQDIFAVTREEAIRKGEAAARRLGTELHDVSGPEDEEDE